MKIRILGCGGAFSTNLYNSCILLEIGTTYVLLDAGSDLKYMLRDSSICPNQIDYIYISHLHSDHIGGMEYLGFINYFVYKHKPVLYGDMILLHDLWNYSLKGGMESLEDGDLPEGSKIGTLDTYFDTRPLKPNNSFLIGDVSFTPIQTCHITNEYYTSRSFGLLIDTGKNKILWTSDIKFIPAQIQTLCDKVELIIHDCETGNHKSRVHAHYDDLLTIKSDTRKKIALIHYGNNSKQNAKEDGFFGFLKQGQVIEIE